MGRRSYPNREAPRDSSKKGSCWGKYTRLVSRGYQQFGSEEGGGRGRGGRGRRGTLG